MHGAFDSHAHILVGVHEFVPGSPDLRKSTGCDPVGAARETTPGIPCLVCSVCVYCTNNRVLAVRTYLKQTQKALFLVEHTHSGKPTSHVFHETIRVGSVQWTADHTPVLWRRRLLLLFFFYCFIRFSSNSKDGSANFPLRPKSHEGARGLLPASGLRFRFGE